MRVRRGFLNWGVFLIVAGAVVLAVRFDALGSDAVEGAWRLWPLILVGIGVGLLLRRTSLEALGGVVVAGTFGYVVGGLLATGFTAGALGCGQTDGLPQLTRDQGAFDRDAAVRLDFTCGDLIVSTGPGNAWAIAAGDTDGKAPNIGRSNRSLTLTSQERAVFGFLGGWHQRWEVTLPQAVPVSLDAAANAAHAVLRLNGAQLRIVDLSANASDLHLDLTDSAVGRLVADLNAGSFSVILPSTGIVAELNGNASSIAMCVPAGIGVRVRTTGNVTTSYDLPGLIRSGDTWVSPNFDPAAPLVDLRAGGSVTSYRLNPVGGCR